MQLTLSEDQEFFRKTTSRFLTEQAPPAELRRLRDDPAGFDPKYWTRGAELGWTSLLVDELSGGGTISGDAVVDLTLVAHEFGSHGSPGPLATANVVAGALSTAIRQGMGSGDHAALLAKIMEGTAIATWCYGEPRPHDGLGRVTLDVRVDRDHVVLSGAKRPVESAGQADAFLVTGSGDGGLTQVVVPADAPGVAIRPLRSVDLTRRFAEITFSDVRLPRTAVLGEPGGAAQQVERQLQIALAVTNAEAVGAMQTAFDTTVEWAFDRYSFGRPLASYQELKHRFADMLAWLEASHAISDRAALSVSRQEPDAAELTSAAAAFIGERGPAVAQDCVQIHGGIGLTFEHDLHFFLRRVTLARALYGTPSQHKLRLADIIEEREAAA